MSAPYTIQVFNGDVGGIDLDFEADTLDEALKIAREETRPGTRGTDIYDADWNHVGWEEGVAA